MIQSQNADLAQILKPSSYWPFSARLKSCPDTKHFSKLARNRLTRTLVLQSSIKRVCKNSTRRLRTPPIANPPPLQGGTNTSAPVFPSTHQSACPDESA